MARYSYSNADRSLTVIRSYPIGKQPKRIRLGEQTLHRDIAADMPRNAGLGTYPRKSHAMGVHPSQIKEAMARDRELGVPVNYASTGAVEFTSRGQEQKWMHAHGFCDNDAGYGDSAPGTTRLSKETA